MEAELLRKRVVLSALMPLLAKMLPEARVLLSFSTSILWITLDTPYEPDGLLRLAKGGVR
jgi:hypothetical protein